MDPGNRIHTGAKHVAYWFEFGVSKGPKVLFDALDKSKKIILMRAIQDFAESEEINTDRGHKESWSAEKIDGSLILFKYKCKGYLERFFAVLHDHPEGRRSVIVHGFKGHQSTRKEKDDPRYQAEKIKAEVKASYYLIWAEQCPGDVQ